MHTVENNANTLNLTLQYCLETDCPKGPRLQCIILGGVVLLDELINASEREQGQRNEGDTRNGKKNGSTEKHST